MKNGKKFECNKCGDPVHFAVNQKGKRYLAIVSLDTGELGKMWHECSAAMIPLYAAVLAEREEARAAAVAKGEIAKGQTVEVFKGRKVPVGTTGVIFWVADAFDGAGITRVGFKTEAGEPHFTDVANVRAIKEGIAK